MPRPAALVLTPRFPWPLDDGGRIVLWQSVWSAARTHDVTLISFVPPAEVSAPVAEPVAAACARIVRVAHRPPPLPVAAWRGALGRWPFTLARYQDPAFARAVREAVARDRPEFALANHLHLAPYVEDLSGVPMVLREHNAEHRWMERQAKDRGPTAAGLYARLQAGRLRRAERELCERAALVLAIQEGEAASLRGLAPEARVRTLPVGIDLGRFLEPSPVRPPVVLLPGSFAWAPNVEGALRFLEEGWPRIRAEAPEARLRLAGKAPPAPLRAAASRAGDRVQVAADVPSMEEEYSRATVVLVPLWVGAGARVKIVEAMAARAPVAATSLAAEGLDLEPELHYACADAPRELADAVVRLLRNPAERLRLGAQGRALAEARWSLESTARLQAALIGEVVGRVGSSRPERPAGEAALRT
ncbi:MAG TPA: glycosyltransferase [Candidatus Eisenbacteria bacterium]|nr:glycosyltransferase [Candidatus Eisenbacteria bacterium]